MAARIAVLPSPSSACPLGGEWTTSTPPSGAAARRSSASSSGRSKLHPQGVVGTPAPRPKKAIPSSSMPSPCRTVAASHRAAAARRSSSVSLLPGTSTVGLSIPRRAPIGSSSPRWMEAKSPAPITTSAWLGMRTSCAARKAREEAGRRAYEAEEHARAREAVRRKHDPFGDRVPDHSVVHRYARCLTYPEWGVGNVTGIYFSGEGDDVQQWARVRFSVGVRTVPAGSLQFVDFSTPDPAAERVERFVTAAQHAMAEGDYALAAQRLVYARSAEPTNPTVLRLMTLAFWQAGNFPAAARAVRDWARIEGDRPAPH